MKWENLKIVEKKKNLLKFILIKHFLNFQKSIKIIMLLFKKWKAENKTVALIVFYFELVCTDRKLPKERIGEGFCYVRVIALMKRELCGAICVRFSTLFPSWLFRMFYDCIHDV